MGEHNPLVHAIAGGVGGVIGATCTYPFDIIKTRMQIQTKLSSETSNYTGLIDAIQQIIKKEGVSGLYRGLQITLIHTLTNQFVYFYFYEALKPYYQRFSGKKDLETFLQLVLGIHAASMNTILTTPLSVVGTRIQTSRKKVGILTTFSNIIQQDGLLSFWSGLEPSLILSINPAITHLCYEKLKKIFETSAKRRPGSLQIFIIAAIAKTIATVLTYPLILSKSRLQWKSSELQYTGLLDVMQKTLRSEGPIGLYAGMNTQVIKAVITQAILFMMKEEIMVLSIKILAIFSKSRQVKTK